jgi:hypothetical protein
MSETPAETGALPIGADRVPLFERLGRELVELVPLRCTCTAKESPQVVDLWSRWRGTLFPGYDLDDAVGGLRSDTSIWLLGHWQFVDFACTFAEAHFLEGRKDEGMAFLDAALRVPRDSVRYSTGERLDGLKARLAEPRAALKLSDAELDVLGALPAETLAELATKSGHELDSVKHKSKPLQNAGFMIKLPAGGFVRTEQGDRALLLRGRSRSGGAEIDPKGSADG